MVSKFKGTKGRWVINDTENRIFGKKDNYHKITAGCGYYDKDRNCGFDISAFISKEDALLISKAPEMLEMLEKLRLIFDNFAMPTESDLKNYSCEINQLIKEATEI
jgi:hypothetical protein